MNNLTPMTELDAVNLMLSLVGEAPISSLNVSGLADVAIARAILLEVSREVQERGWGFNIEHNVEYPLSVEGYIYIPPNILRIDLESDQDALVTQRGNRLYDRKNHTYVFDKTLLTRITVMLDFEELPQAARHYITIRAARKFQKRAVSSDNLEKFTQEEETLALAQLNDYDTDVHDYNLFTGSSDIARILRRY